MAKSATTTNGSSKKAAAEPVKRGYVQQSLLPKRKLRDAMLIPQAIIDNYGGKDAAPHQVAMAIDSSPTSSSWRDLTGAAIAYGLTEGGYNSDKIALTDLGRRCVAPTVEGEDVAARNEAAMRPQILRQFFEKYDKNKFPDDKIAKNVLQHNFGVPADRCDEVLAIVKDNGAYVGVLHNTKTGLFVAVNNPEPSVSVSDESAEVPAADDDRETSHAIIAEIKGTSLHSKSMAPSVMPPALGQAIFVAHGKNKKPLEQLKHILDQFKVPHRVATDEPHLGRPISQKVRETMHECNCAVLIFTADEEFTNKEGRTIWRPSENVVHELGASGYLYDKRIVILKEDGVTLPSNFSDLGYISFAKDQLDAKAMEVLKELIGFGIVKIST